MQTKENKKLYDIEYRKKNREKIKKDKAKWRKSKNGKAGDKKYRVEHKKERAKYLETYNKTQIAKDLSNKRCKKYTQTLKGKICKIKASNRHRKMGFHRLSFPLFCLFD